MKRYIFSINTPNLFLSHRLKLAQKLMQDGFEVHVVTVKSELCEKIRAAGIGVKELDIKRHSINPFTEVSTLLQMYQAYQEIQPDVINSYTVKNNVYTSLMAPFFRKAKVVLSVTGLGYAFTSSSLRAKIARGILSIAYKFCFKQKNVKVLFQNPFDQNLFIRNSWVKKENTYCLSGTGIISDDFEVVNKERSKPIKILFPARVIVDKGVRELLEAASILISKTTLSFDLQICGSLDEDYKGQLTKQELSEAAKNESIKFLGYQSNMKPLFQDADIVCLPSYREGIPLALIEACAYGKAIVATDVPGCSEAVIDGYNGFLVKPKNAFDLANKLEKLMLNESLRKEFAAKSRLLAEEKFDISKIYPDFKKIVA